MRRALVGLLGAALASPAIAAPVGNVVAVTGDCFTELSNRRQTMVLNSPVNVGDTVGCADSGKMRVRMSDGSIISVAASTRVVINAYQADQRGRTAKFGLVSGLLRTVVAAVSGQSRFEVETATGVAAVRSTDWFIEAKPGTTQVGVLDGSVALTSLATAQSVTIPARWGARVEAGKNPVPARVWTRAEFDAVIARTNLP